MFREAFNRRRCLVTARGYFEWKGEDKAKQPYFIHDPDGELLMFAGLWESWRETKEAEPLYTYTIVTGPPGIVSGDIHDRAPVILAPVVRSPNHGGVRAPKGWQTASARGWNMGAMFRYVLTRCHTTFFKNAAR